MSVASSLTRQMARGTFNTAGLGFADGGRTFVAGARTHARSLMRRAVGTGNAPNLQFDLIDTPLAMQLSELGNRVTPEVMRKTVFAVTLRILGKTKLLTPVDTGLARAVWRAAEVIVGALRGGGGGAGGPEARHLRHSLRHSAARTELQVENNLTYILPLEFGWSAQAPAGMLRLSIAMVAGYPARYIAELFRAEWLEAMLVAAKQAQRELRAFSNRGGRGAGGRYVKGRSIMRAGVTF